MGEVITAQPFILSARDAAAFLGMSEPSFRKEVLPSIKQIQLFGTRKGYLRIDLERWALYKAGRVERATDQNPWDDLG